MMKLFHVRGMAIVGATAFGMLGVIPLASAVTVKTASLDSIPSLPTPSANFSPLTATNAQLQQYGFPPRPTGGSALALWDNVMARAQHYVAPTATQGPGMSENSGQWAGWAAQSGNNGHVLYDQAEAEWVQPSVRSNSNYSGSSAPSAGFWAGIGGQNPNNGGDVIQAGTLSTSDSTAGYRFFVEDAPQNPVYVGPFVSPGDTIYVDVDYNPDTYDTSFFLENVTTGQYTPYSMRTIDYDSTSAEVVAENPFLGTYPLPDFGSVSFTGAVVGWVNEPTGDNGDLANQNITEDVITGNEASPTDMNTSSSGFTVNWHTGS